MKSQISQNRTFLMGLAMIAVVLFHHGWVIVPGVTAFFSRFGLWGVDVFLFLSGFGCVYSLNKVTTVAFWRRRVIRILPVCLLAGIIIYAVDQYFHAERTITYLPIRLLSMHRWYIQAILFCYLICPFAYLCLKRFKVLGLLILVTLSLLAEMWTPEWDVWKISWALGRLPVFFIGMYIAEFDLKMSKWLYIISGICLIIAVIIRCVGGNNVVKWTYFLAAAMPFVCETLCRLRNICIRLRIYQFIELFGVYSLEIYLIHEYFYWALYEFDLPLWIKYLVFVGVVTILCYILKLAADYLVNKVVKKVLI